MQRTNRRLGDKSCPAMPCHVCSRYKACHILKGDCIGVEQVGDRSQQKRHQTMRLAHDMTWLGANSVIATILGTIARYRIMPYRLGSGL
ncbi:hypothetical protein D9M70_517190 [compost metagenome]